MRPTNKPLDAQAQAVASNVTPNEIGNNLHQLYYSFYASEAERKDAEILQLTKEVEILKESIKANGQPVINELLDLWQENHEDKDGNFQNLKDILMLSHNEIVHYLDATCYDADTQNNCYVLSKIANVLGKLKPNFEVR
jgi:hypothetical protein